MPDAYIIPPGSTYEPGDVFEAVPFPNLRHPFKRYRLSTKPREKNRPEIFESIEGTDKPGDIIHSTFERKYVMLLSHGCELDKVLKLGASADRRQWSCAPLEPFAEKTSNANDQAREQRIRDGIQWNRFYIPKNEFLLPPREFRVDLRRITPLPALYILEAKKVCSLTEDARYDLYSHMGVNQSGLQIYLEAVTCQNCGTQVEAKQFFVPSNDDVEDDRE
jgi:hypothetical protein